MKGRFSGVCPRGAGWQRAAFGYDLCPSPLVGLICPVSESVWGIWLLYWPFWLRASS